LSDTARTGLSFQLTFPKTGTGVVQFSPWFVDLEKKTL
jgi:hypothetical protein